MANTLANRLPMPGADLQGYLQAVNSFPLLSAEEERELAGRYRRDQDLEAAWQLVTSHLRYVVKITRGYLGYGLPHEDLIQEGNIGLMKAAKRFDPEVGVRFVSFAVHWVRAEIHEFVLRNWRIVKVATTKAQRKLFFNLRSRKKRLGWLSQREVEEVAEDLGVRPDDVLEMERRLASQDAAFDGAEDDAGEERPAPGLFIEDRRYEPGAVVEEEEWAAFTSGHMSAALEDIDERSRDIITRRWLREPKAKLRELAEEYGISAERVRQIEAGALASLRKAIEHRVRPGLPPV
jgi:RNA polymerase sigma-32 factor